MNPFLRAMIVALSLLAIADAGELIGPGRDDFDRETGSIGEGTGIVDYELFRPPGFDSHSDKLPLVVFLHGSTDGLPSKQARLNQTMRDLVQTTQRSNVDRHRVTCVDSLGEADPSCSDFDERFTSFLLVPKRINGSGWGDIQHLGVNDLITDLSERYEIDPNRVYLSGFSDGGFTVISELSARGRPERFAAGVSLAGGGSVTTRRVDALKEVPIWFFHGAEDPAVSSSNSTDLHEALVAAGGNSRLTLVPSVRHNSSYEVAFRDANNEFYPWLFSQSLAVPEPSSHVLVLFALLAMCMTFRQRHGLLRVHQSRVTWRF